MTFLTIIMYFVLLAKPFKNSQLSGTTGGNSIALDALLYNILEMRDFEYFL